MDVDSGVYLAEGEEGTVTYYVGRMKRRATEGGGGRGGLEKDRELSRGGSGRSKCGHGEVEKVSVPVLVSTGTCMLTGED